MVRQAERIEQLEAEVAELRWQVRQNSRNSSKPPSSDSPFTKPAVRSLRRKRAQAGRSAGASRLDVGAGYQPRPAPAARARPVYRLRRRPEEGPGSRCGAAAGVRLAADDGARDRTPAHRAPLRLWDHHLRHRGAGRERAGAVWAADHCDHPLPVCGPVLVEKRTAAALAELFATPVSEGTVATVATRAANGLAEFLTQVGDRIAACEVAGFDETACAWRAGCTGCTAPAPASTP